jgi:hypothetical protein
VAAKADKEAVYRQIITKVFEDRFEKGSKRVEFSLEDLEKAAAALKLKRPKNLPDVPYAYRFRHPLPKAVCDQAPRRKDWVIRITGKGTYAFEPVKQAWFKANPALEVTKIPDATPGLIERYALNDEQAVLAVLRYNRLIDVFSGVTCYSLQNHLRTTVEVRWPNGEKGRPQIETDEIYLGVDRRGAHYLFPVQAKGGNDLLSVVQIEQDFLLCRKRKFRDLIPVPVGAQFIDDDDGRLIALFQFVQDARTKEVSLAREKHYRLVPGDDISDADLDGYAKLFPD